MSWLSKYVFDPIKTVFARSATSSNPATAAMGAAGIAAVHDISISAGASSTTAACGRSSRRAIGRRIGRSGGASGGRAMSGRW